MPGRIYNDTAFRFGFNGKEKDDEVKGVGNQLDFGARGDDPRLGRWLSLDQLMKKYPDASPYSFSGNNPLRFVDPGGQFLLDVHQRITKNALAVVKGPVLTGSNSLGYPFDASFKMGMVGDESALNTGAGITDPDIHHSGAINKSAYDAGLHFDNMNYNQILTNNAKIQVNITNSVIEFNEGKKSAYNLGHDVGVAAHAIQDLYSHSNYVELYAQFALPGVKAPTAEQLEGLDITKIPTIEEAFTNPQYKEFADLLKNNLKTGSYPGSGSGSHKEMNHDIGAGSPTAGLISETKDKKVNWYSRAAEGVATKATTEFVNGIKNTAKKN